VVDTEALQMWQVIWKPKPQQVLSKALPKVMHSEVQNVTHKAMRKAIRRCNVRCGMQCAKLCCQPCKRQRGCRNQKAMHYLVALRPAMCKCKRKSGDANSHMRWRGGGVTRGMEDRGLLIISHPRVHLKVKGFTLTWVATNNPTISRCQMKTFVERC